MGLATAINFQPTGDGKAAITGDFVLVGKEVNPVIRALRSNGIEVTAVHSHMLDEQPRLFFMHFWANDNAEKLLMGCGRRLTKPRVPRARTQQGKNRKDLREGRSHFARAVWMHWRAKCSARGRVRWL